MTIASVLSVLCGTVFALPPGEVLIEDEGLRGVLVADVDLDGRPDLLTGGLNTVTIRRAFRDAEPGAVTVLDVGRWPGGLLVHDFNADGMPDIAVGDNDTDTVGIFLADGLGGFVRTKDHLGVRRGPRYMEVGDVDGDGVEDLVVGNSGSTSEVFVFRGLGGGRFIFTSAFRTMSMHRGMALRDFDEDGLLDLVLVHGTLSGDLQGVHMYRGQVGGGFGDRVILQAPFRPWALAVADFDGDGLEDLVIASGNSESSVRLLRNLPGPGFAPMEALPTDDYSSSVSAGDFNGDGLVDLAVGYDTSNSTRFRERVDLLRNTGGGCFEVSERVYLGEGTVRVMLAQVDADGGMGLIAEVDRPSQLVVLPIDAYARVSSRASFPLQMRPERVFAGDFNRDGVGDFVVIDSSRTMAVYLSDASGALAPAAEIDYPGWWRAVTMADVNADGWPDLVFGARHTDAFGVLLGQADGSFAPVGPAATGEVVRVADVDGDGVPDFVSFRYEQAALFVFKGLGDGLAGPATAVAIEGAPKALETGDFDGDGVVDVLVVLPGEAPGTSVLRVLLGDGLGGFAPGAGVTIGDWADRVLVGDADGDGRSDTASWGMFTGGVTVRLTGPGGVLGAGVLYGAGEEIGGVHLADVTGDGLVDLVTTVADRNVAEVRAGIGDGSFGPARAFVAGIEPGDVASADFNADGVADLVVVNEGVGSQRDSRGVSVLALDRCVADAAAPFGVLDATDAGRFVTLFLAQDAGADIAAPFGVWDFRDLRAFVAAYGAGCP